MMAKWSKCEVVVMKPGSRHHLMNRCQIYRHLSIYLMYLAKWFDHIFFAVICVGGIMTMLFIN